MLLVILLMPTHAVDEIMMTSSNGKIFRVTGHSWGESTGDWWIPLTKASDGALLCFIWSAPEQTVGETIRRRWFETPSRSLWRHCDVHHFYSSHVSVNNVWIVHTKSFLRLETCCRILLLSQKLFISIFLNTATGLDWVFLAQWEVHGRHIQR